MSAPLFDYGKAVRSEPGKPRALNTVASSSQCQPPRFGLERKDVGEQVTRDRALSPRSPPRSGHAGSVNGGSQPDLGRGPGSPQGLGVDKPPAGPCR